MKAVFTLITFFVSSLAFANNIQLQKVSLSDTNRTAKTVNIKFNISWEHSWRDSINWDAAWIMIRYKEPKDSLWKWKQAQLSVSGNNTGTAVGVKIVVPNDLIGAFFYRSAIGSGNISSENVKLSWNYGAAGVTNIDSVEVRVFATEMVYVPQGNFCLGDGNGNGRSVGAFQLKKSPNNYAVINDKWSGLITTDGNSGGGRNLNDDQILYTSGIRISGNDGLDVNDDRIADYPNFPTGYKGFYCMKYKVTQGQYADFLNSPYANDTSGSALDGYLNSTLFYDASNPGKYKTVPKQLRAVWAVLGDLLYAKPSYGNRNTISFDSTQQKFIVSRPDRAYGRMDLNKSLSFSEWFGLRPMTELEFEKACRGPLPPFYSYPYYLDNAWGNDTTYPTTYTTLTYSGVENGAETFSNYDVTKRYVDPTGSDFSTGSTGGDGGSGPYRVGIFATDTSSRISSGASYFGIMDLSKITTETVISVSNSVSRGCSYYSNGKGILSAFGDNYSFRNLTGGFTPTTIDKKGATSYRGGNSTTNMGFRAVRLAPADN